MVVSTQPFQHDPRAVSQTLFDLAKRNWWLSLFCRAVIFFVGLLAVLLTPVARYAPLVVLFLTVGAELWSWRMSQLKSIAEAFLRKLDVFDSFGWSLSPAEMSDLLTRIPVSIRRRLPTQKVTDDYFASKEGKGPKRAVENVQESAWWSKHLSSRMWQLCFSATVVVIFISLFVLLVSAQTVRDFNTLANVGRMVTNTVMFIFSFGLLRLTIDYHTFSKRAERIEQQALAFLQSGNYNPEQAIKLFNEYHLARATAPLIPTELWNLMGTELNELWDGYRK